MISVPNNSNLYGVGIIGVYILSKESAALCFVAFWNPIMEEATTSCDFFILVLYERNVFFVIMVCGVKSQYTCGGTVPSFG